MKKIFILVAAISSFDSAYAQTFNGNYLDINNVKAKINSDGSLFNDYGTTFNLGFEVPKGSGRQTIYTGGLWIGGYDAGGALKIAGQTYRQTGYDFWPGPLTSTATIDSATIQNFNRVWKINQCDITAYQNWALIGGAPGTNPVDSISMEVIYSWPTISPDGSPLAPFYDINGNGIYDPYLGEVPKIKGDQAIFFVYNDKGGVHTETGGASIGVEIQGMAYAYSCSGDSALYNTIFTNYKIINKSASQLDSVFVGNWTDIDIGSGGDDFTGSDVTRGAYYGYNGDSIDGPPFPGELAYGANPPAQAIVFLGGPLADSNGVDDAAFSTPNGFNYGDGIVDNERLGMSKFMYYNNDFTVTGNPNHASDYYSYLSGSWLDTTNFTYGGTGHISGGVTCDYMFPGTSDPLGYGTNMVPQVAWDEYTAGDAPADRRGLGSFGPFKFQPGAIEEIDFAYVFGRATSGGNLASVAVMKERIDSVRHKFSSPIAGCGCSTSTGIKELTNEDSFSIYPNPASDNITITLKISSKNYSIRIYDATGRLVKNIECKNSTTNTIDINDLRNGIYLINLQDGNNSLTKRFIKD